MKRSLDRLCLLLLIFFVCSCASKAVAPPSEWGYEKDAIRLHVKADSQLNLYEETPHTLLVCVYELRDPNAFNQLTEDEDGLYKLLECGPFDASVASSKRLIINPGQESTFGLDRAEGAKYVAIVAGYYLIQKERMVGLFDIPVVEEKKGLLRLTKVSKPGTLDIELRLGPQQIVSQHAKGKE